MSESLNAYQLAHLADVPSPDAPDSPGAQWLLQVASYADEIVVPDDYPQDTIQDAITEAADSCVPINTHNKWEV